MQTWHKSFSWFCKINMIFNYSGSKIFLILPSKSTKELLPTQKIMTFFSIPSIWPWNLWTRIRSNAVAAIFLDQDFQLALLLQITNYLMYNQRLNLWTTCLIHMIYTNVLFFLWRRDTLLCFKHIPLNSTILLILKSPVIFEAKLTSEICGF